MRSDWILDVLADLKTFEKANDLPVLAEQLDDTAIVALTEISALHEKVQGNSDGDDHICGTDIGGVGTSGHA